MNDRQQLAKAPQLAEVEVRPAHSRGYHRHIVGAFGRTRLSTAVCGCSRGLVCVSVTSGMLAGAPTRAGRDSARAIRCDARARRAAVARGRHRTRSAPQPPLRRLHPRQASGGQTAASPHARTAWRIGTRPTMPGGAVPEEHRAAAYPLRVLSRRARAPAPCHRRATPRAARRCGRAAARRSSSGDTRFPLGRCAW